MASTPIIGVTWNDAHGSDGTISAHEVDHKPYVYTSIGFLVRSDEVGVSVAAEQGEDGKFRDITFIPRKMIQKEFPISPKRTSGPRKSNAKKANPPTLLPINSFPPSTGQAGSD